MLDSRRLTMNREIGLTPEIFGIGSGIFFLGYFAFEVPSTIILHKVGRAVLDRPRDDHVGPGLDRDGVHAGPDQLLRAAVSARARGGGFLSGDHSVPELLVSRGSPVGGDGNGLWRRRRLPDSIGSPLSGALLQLHGVAGLQGWQWLFLLEGVPAVVLGVVTFGVPHRPAGDGCVAERTTSAMAAERD